MSEVKDKPIYVNPRLHSKLKAKAAKQDRKLYELAEELLEVPFRKQPKEAAK